jgi:predicted nucleotidyltransferase
MAKTMDVRNETDEGEINTSQIERIVALAKAYGATRLILFGSTLESPSEARDVDLACDGVPGWKLYELGARLEEELRRPLDLIPLSPASRFTRLVEARGKVLL